MFCLLFQSNKGKVRTPLYTTQRLEKCLKDLKSGLTSQKQIADCHYDNLQRG